MPLIPDLASFGMRGPRQGNHGLESRTDGHAFHWTGDMMATSPSPSLTTPRPKSASMEKSHIYIYAHVTPSQHPSPPWMGRVGSEWKRCGC
ncbi:hypothetical protein CDAR_18231 [Caerostris darwini]|uniref:Uncharacterized protein n=1 Tax=Caerostris darwini TaxID=1538125 RepID=A0AAV4V9I2_9ARAC|nr:hypothetical protein CDAR_18231 [Caerostris darwini]